MAAPRSILTEASPWEFALLALGGLLTIALVIAFIVLLSRALREKP